MITNSDYELLTHLGESILWVFLVFAPIAVMYRRRFYLKGIKYYPLLFSLIELPVIISCIYLICSGTVIHVTDYQQKEVLNPYIYPSLSCLLSVMGFFLFAILMLYFRPRLKSYLFMMGVPLACYLVYFARDQYGKISDVTNEELVTAYTAAVNPSLMVPEVWVVISKLLFLLVPLMFPFLMVKSLRQEWLFLFWLVFSAAIVSLFLTDPIHVYQGYIISVFFLVMLGLILYYAPISRKNLRVIFEISKRSKAQKRNTLLVLLFFSGVNACFVWYMGIHWVRPKQDYNVVKSWRYPAEVNLIDALGSGYGRVENIPDSEEDLYDKVYELQWNSKVYTADGIVIHQDFPAVECDLIDHKEQIDYFLNGIHQADYFLNAHEHWGYLRRLRDLARIACFRARCRMARGDTDTFCADMELIYRLGEISNKGEDVVLLHGSSFKSLANERVFEYLQFLRNNPDDLWRLKESLDRSKEGCSYLGPFDFMGYVKKKHQGYSIVGLGDPSYYSRAFAIQQRNLAQFDHLRLLIALYLYYHDYAEWPDELSQLTPVYIDEIPANPHTGKPYVYSYSDEGVSLETKVTKYPEDFDIYYDYPIGSDIIPANVPNDGFDVDEKDQRDSND